MTETALQPFDLDGNPVISYLVGAAVGRNVDMGSSWPFIFTSGESARGTKGICFCPHPISVGDKIRCLHNIPRDEWIIHALTEKTHLNDSSQLKNVSCCLQWNWCVLCFVVLKQWMAQQEKACPLASRRGSSWQKNGCARGKTSK